MQTDLTTPAATAATGSAAPSGGSAFVELGSIRRGDNGKLVVCLVADKRSWQVEVTGSQLQTFTRFQAAVADTLGLWVDHESQFSMRAETRRREWADDVAAAFAQGAHP